MNELQEFFIPTRISDLVNASRTDRLQYCVDAASDFDVPARQQLDDLTRLFDFLCREKSPTALFTNRELFSALYLYIKGLNNAPSEVQVIKAARHKICHEIGERMKKLLEVAAIFLKKRKDNVSSSTASLEICLRSTLKMHAFVLCSILMSVAPPPEEDEGGFDGIVTPSQRRAGRRKRRLGETEAGFGDDESGVDMDGRELVLTSLIELCTPEIASLWPNSLLENETLNLLMKMILRMITQKSNIQNDAQSIASALALLLARVTSQTLANNQDLNLVDFTSPLLELCLKSENAALFMSKYLADLEQEDGLGLSAEKVIRSFFENLVHVALYDATSDAATGKNVSLFLSEVSRRSVSITVKVADIILPCIQSENYDIRKAVITCLLEMILQRYTNSTLTAEDAKKRNEYLNELLFRIMDLNAFVRNHTLRTWEKLADAKAVPKRFHIALTEAVVGRLEDKNYLVRDSAMSVMCCILRKNWFGQALSLALIGNKLEESKAEVSRNFANDEDAIQKHLGFLRREFRPINEALDDPLQTNQANEEYLEEEQLQAQEPKTLTNEEIAALSKMLFYENALCFVQLVGKALQFAITLLDSRTERDVIESIKLIVACSEYHLEQSDKALRKVLVMVFDGEVKIQFAVRDAFAEVVFGSFNRLACTSVTRATASAQRLSSILNEATEGEMAAVDRIFGLLKLNTASSRYLAGPFMDAVWTIIEAPTSPECALEDSRTAMRIYSLLSKHYWKDLRVRKESILEFLESPAHKDNILLSYLFTALEYEALDAQFRPISATEDPKTHRLLKHFVTHLCRKTTAITSWMCLARSIVSAIHRLCDVPLALYNYVLEYFGTCLGIRCDANTKSQLLFLLGQTAFKQLIAIESAEHQQLKALEGLSKTSKDNNNDNSEVTDSMQKELGWGSYEFKRHAMHELAQQQRRAILSPGSVWHRFLKTVVSVSFQKRRTSPSDRPLERVCAIMTLCQFMIIDEDFCKKHLNVMLSIASDKHESWVVKSNIVIALGDLACVHPNLLAPYLSVPSTGLFKMLGDEDRRVRAVTIQVCSHLVLGEMLRVRDHLYAIVRLVADPDETISRNAVTFVQNLAMKEKEKIGNLIPPLVSQLSGLMPSEKFQLAMRTLLERVEGDRPTDSLVERLCQSFGAFSERSLKKRQLARNLAFCLSELNYSTDRSIKRITSEACYQQYRHWLRDPEVLQLFKFIATKAKKSGRVGAERRERSAIEEWECRMLADLHVEDSQDQAQGAKERDDQ